jgi:plastocyanin
LINLVTQRIRHYFKKRREDIFRTESHIDWEFVISVALAIIFGLVTFSFFIMSKWAVGIIALLIAIFLLVPEESISGWIRMRFTWKHKAVIIIILLIVAGYFYLQKKDEGMMPVIDTEAATGGLPTEEGAGSYAGNAGVIESVEEQPARIKGVFVINMTDHLEPAILTVPLGSTVVWQNVEKRPHTIHIYSMDGGYRTVALGDKMGLAGDRWEYTFNQTGEFFYRDIVFNWRGNITVE